MNAQYLTPVVTLFDSHGNLDLPACHAVYDHLIEGGMDGMVLLGSIGEFFGIPLSMQKQLLDDALPYIGGRVKVLVGAGGMSPVADVADLADFAHSRGADGVLVISPFYFPLGEQDLESYYDEVMRRVHCPVYVYNFPDRTNSDLSPALTLRLLRKHKGIVGYKDTLVSMGHTRELISAVHAEFPDFQIYSGFDDNLAHNVLSGGSGCISALSNIMPEICSGWVKALRANDLEAAATYQQAVNQMIPLYDICSPFVPTIKKAMMLRGLPIQDFCTFPMAPISAEHTAQLQALMERAGLI